MIQAYVCAIAGVVWTIGGLFADDGSVDKWVCYALASLWFIAGNVITALVARRP